VNTGINLRVLKKARDFITRRTTTGLSKRILPHIAVSLQELGHFHSTCAQCSTVLQGRPLIQFIIFQIIRAEWTKKFNMNRSGILHLHYKLPIATRAGQMISPLDHAVTRSHKLSTIFPKDAHFRVADN
jgi:hypothetical protein